MDSLSILVSLFSDTKSMAQIKVPSSSLINTHTFIHFLSLCTHNPPSSLVLSLSLSEGRNIRIVGGRINQYNSFRWELCNIQQNFKCTYFLTTLLQEIIRLIFTILWNVVWKITFIANTEFSKIPYVNYHSQVHTQYIFVPIFFTALAMKLDLLLKKIFFFLRLTISIINFSFFIVPSNELSNSVSFASTVSCIQFFSLNQ